MTMDQRQARGVMNQLFYPIDGAPDLGDATAARLVDNMIDGRLFSAGVEDFAAAIDLTLQAGTLDPQTAEASRRYTEPELIDFLRRVARELAARRPWPPKRFTKLDVTRWDSFGAAVVVARIDRPRHQINGALGLSFDHVAAGDGRLPVLLLRLRTGEEVAVVGSVDARSTSFALLNRGPEDPAEVVAHFKELAGLRDGDVSSV
jgi:hypothetical protein